METQTYGQREDTKYEIESHRQAALERHENMASRASKKMNKSPCSSSCCLAAMERGHRHRLHRRYCCYSIKGTVVHKASDAAPLVQASQAAEIPTPVTTFAVLL